MLPSSLLSLVALVPSVLAGIGTFQISQPLQCGELLINWSHTGSIAATDYNLVLIPTSDQNQVLSNLTFQSTTNTYTLPQLPLGKGVEFIALLQDNVDGADGGRVSQVVKVADQDAGGTGCLADLDHSLDGSFAVSTTTPTQCGDFTVTWTNDATAPVGITGLIPGGMSFDVPVTDPGSNSASWPFRVLAGSKVLFAMHTGGRKGSAGSSPLYTVGSGSDSCIRGAGNSEAAVIYSSLPVGDVPTTLTVYATLTVSGQATTVFATQSAAPGGSSSGQGSTGTSNNTGGGGTNVGAIAGGVVGGVAFLLLLAFLIWFCIRKRDRKALDEKNAANNDMTAAGRPWSPPLPSDPETNPIYQPSPAFFGNGGGTGSAHNSMVGLGSPGSTHASSNSLYNNSSSGAGPQSFAPSAFSHIPPGAMTGSSSGGHGSESDGRNSMEKRGYPAAGGSGSGGRGDGELGAPPALGEDSRRDSVTRFVRHEDAGALPASGEGRSPDEVVDLPPLYQDAGERASATGH